MSVVNRLINLLLTGCRHPNLTSVITTRKSKFDEKISRVVCISCGAEFSYNWEEMKIGRRLKPTPVFGGMGVVGAGKVVVSVAKEVKE